MQHHGSSSRTAGAAAIGQPSRGLGETVDVPSSVEDLVADARVVLGYGFVIPRSCIAGLNELTIGFGTTVLGACVTYVLGVRQARRL